MYRIVNYYTDKIIDVANNWKKALQICKLTPDSVIESDSGDTLYSNIDLPF